MNGEIAIIISTVFGCGLFALGGTEIPSFGKGFKWIRRELLPIVWAVLAFTAGFEWWRCAGFAISQDCVFRLPYGEKTPVWMKLVIFMTYPLPSLFFGLTIWQAYVGALCFILWALSNWKVTERMFSWVIACLLIGSFMGIMVGQLIAQVY